MKKTKNEGMRGLSRILQYSSSFILLHKKYVVEIEGLYIIQMIIGMI